MGGVGASNPLSAGAAKPGQAIPQTIASSMAAQIRDGIRRGDKVRIVIEAPGRIGKGACSEKAASCSFFVYFVLVACTSNSAEGAILSSTLAIGNSTAFTCCICLTRLLNARAVVRDRG